MNFRVKGGVYDVDTDLPFRRFASPIGDDCKCVRYQIRDEHLLQNCVVDDIVLSSIFSIEMTKTICHSIIRYKKETNVFVFVFVFVCMMRRGNWNTNDKLKFELTVIVSKSIGCFMIEK
jgi:hypothetical protein